MENEIEKIPLITYMPIITQEKVTRKKDIFQLFRDLSKTAYFEDTKRNITLFKANCFDILPNLPENSIDMIFADPPYFLSNGGITCHAGKMVSVNKGKWDESRGGRNL